MMIWWSALGNSKCLLPKSYKKKVWHYHCNALVAITIKNRWVKVKVDRISLLNWIKNYFAILLWVSNWFCKEQIMIISFLVLRASWLWNASIQHRVNTLNSVRKKHGTFLVECVHQCSKPWTRRRCTTYITSFHALCAEWHFGAETIFWIISEKFTIKLTSLVSSFTVSACRCQRHLRAVVIRHLRAVVIDTCVQVS